MEPLTAADVPEPIEGWVLRLTHEGADGTRAYAYFDPTPGIIGASLALIQWPDGTVESMATIASFAITDGLTPVR